MRRGFKTEARMLALELRAELGLDAFGQFDPYALADEYGVPVFRLSDLGQDPVAREAVARYGRTARPPSLLRSSQPEARASSWITTLTTRDAGVTASATRCRIWCLNTSSARSC